jgi:hypothetical protein
MNRLILGGYAITSEQIAWDDKVPSHLRLAPCGPGLIRYQTSTRVIRRAQE